MKRPKVLLVTSTTGYQTQMFVEAASRVGVDIVLASDRCHVLDDPWGDRAVPVRFEAPEPAADLIKQQGKIAGIIALGDRPAWVAAILAPKLGILYNSVESVEAAGNKFLSRQRFREAGLLLPEFFRAPMEEDPRRAAELASYPCVLKPLGMSASRGVIRANSPGEFCVAFRRIVALLQKAKGVEPFIQVERFIPGAEFALEGLLTDGRLQVFALFDKPDPLDGPFFEETIYVTPSGRPQNVQKAIFETTQLATEVLGLRHGPIHAEMRVNSAGVWMLEVAARPIGGLCARVLPGLPEAILSHAAGVHDFTFANASRAHGVMMIPIPRAGIYQDVRGIEAARAVTGIEDIVITAKQGYKLVPLPEGSSYLGFIFAAGDTAEIVEQSLRQAHAEMQFEITTELQVW